MVVLGLRERRQALLVSASVLSAGSIIGFWRCSRAISNEYMWQW